MQQKCETSAVCGVPKLKVYRTPIGFHDVYVAAPSQKAALAAWGSDANLFARGVAEQVDDPALTAEPLTRPGEVIRKLRGSAEEQIAALPKGKARKSEAKPKPPPSRAALDAAEQALAELDERQQRERQRQAAERKKFEQKLDRAREAYERAVERWRR